MLINVLLIKKTCVCAFSILTASLRSEIRAKTGIDPITDPPGISKIYYKVPSLLVATLVFVVFIYVSLKSSGKKIWGVWTIV